MDKQEIIERLDALALKLGVGIEHLWGVLIRQAYVEAVGTLLIWLVMSALAYAAWANLSTIQGWIKNSPNEKSRWEDNLRRPFVWASVISYLFVFSMVTFYALTHVPTMLLNPEYYALKEIADFIK